MTAAGKTVIRYLMQVKRGSRFNDLKGKIFGRLFVKQVAGRDEKFQLYWLCQCECGNLKIIQHGNLLSGNTVSCGCKRRPHGYTSKRSKRSEYSSWVSARRRCNDPTYRQYKDYGGRGIQFSTRWLKFENFIKDMGDKPSLLHSLERRDNNGNYEASNCRWATKKEQGNNRRTNHFIEFSGKRMTVQQWAEFLGVKDGLLRGRLHLGWPIYRVLTTTISTRLRSPLKSHRYNRTLS